MRLILLAILAIGLIHLGVAVKDDDSKGDEILSEEDYDDVKPAKQVHLKEKKGEKGEDKSKKSESKKVHETEDEEEDEGPIAICDGSKTEACHCDNGEVFCNAIIFENEEVLNTLDVRLDLPKDSKFVAYSAYFSDNYISAIRKNQLPEGMESSLSALHIDHNRITTITTSAFAGFTNLTKLNLEHNRIPTVKREWFLGDIGDTLHVLDLGWNRIKTLGPKPFSALTNLRKLILDANPIKLSADTFAGLDNLEELSLDECDLKELDKEILKPLKKLKSLSLRNNKFTDIPYALTEDKTFQYLDLTGNLLSEIHRDTFAEDLDVIELYLEDMPFLQSIDDCAFCGMESLQMISLNNCSKLNYIHPNAFGFNEYVDDRTINLVDIRISYTNVTKLNKDLVDYDKLTNLEAKNVKFNCTCDQAFLRDMKGHADFITGKCAYPAVYKGRVLVEVEEMCESSFRMRRYFVALTGALIAASSITILYVMFKKGYRFTNLRSLPLPNVLPNSAARAYSNLNGQEDTDALEMNMAETAESLPDFQPRPQAV